MPVTNFQRGIYKPGTVYSQDSFQEINVGINIYLLAPNLQPKTCAEIIIFQVVFIQGSMWHETAAQIYVIDTLCVAYRGTP